MGLFDQAREAAFALGKAKLTKGVGAAATNIVEPLLRRAINLGGNPEFSIQSAPGARDPLQAGRARLDPLMSYNWFCDLPIIDGKELSWEYVEEATLPFVEFDQASNYRAGKMYHYANHHSIGTLTLKLYEDSQGIASNYLDTWRRRILDLDSGLYYFPRDYKQTVSITLLDVSKLTVMFLEYSGCWPLRTDSYQMNSGSSDRIAPTVELSVDEMRVKFGKFDSGQIPSIINAVGVDFPPRLSSLLEQFPGNFTDLAVSSASKIF